jgi:acetyl-CoA C-acetyltransferase
MRKVVIVSAARTPVGSFNGLLSSVPATSLGSVVIGGALKESPLNGDEVDEVIMGNVLSAGLGQAPARQASLGAGLSKSVGCTTVNKVCGSGLKAVMLANQAIAAGDADVVVAGGMESMSNAPYLLTKARSGYHMGHGQLVDSMIQDGLWDVYNQFHMGKQPSCAPRSSASRERIKISSPCSVIVARSKRYKVVSSDERSFRSPCRNGTEPFSWWRKMKSQSA